MVGDYRLIAVHGPVADAAGFVEPIFLAGERRFVQVVDAESDRIAGFAEAAPELPTSVVAGAEEDETALVSPGLRRIYAFRLPDGRVLYGDRESLTRQLTQGYLTVLDAEAVGGHPLVVLDVLSFLGRDGDCGEELLLRRLAALMPEEEEGNAARGAARRLFQRGFVYRSVSGKLFRPALPDMVCLGTGELRAVVREGVGRVRSGRLFPVLCLALLACTVVLAPPLAAHYSLSPATLTIAAQGVAGLSVIWLLAELTGFTRRLGRMAAADWIVARLKRAMQRR